MSGIDQAQVPVFLLTIRIRKKSMDQAKELKKEIKKEEIIILDKGISTGNITESWNCCYTSLFPIRT
jgi:hypothetical protein